MNNELNFELIYAFWQLQKW